jgi:hypothetical protein
MTQMEVTYRYGDALIEGKMTGIDSVREVYGIRKITFDPDARVVRVEFDASRLQEATVAGLLRRAGIDVKEKLVLA